MVSTKIKIKYGGCGIKYKDGNGVERHALKTPEDGPFLCEIEQAKRLVNLGVAEYVGEPIQAPESNTGDTEGIGTTGHLDAADLEKMSYPDLKKLAADMGVKPEGGQKREHYIAAIVAAEVEAGDEIDPDDEDDGLPDLNAADPE